ncbi:thiamine pyrophosphate-dependent enzyme [Waltera sp.]|uniref:thiamine pyrophosphate-dependent enzyme n=1 Tax=Waltera sp. TaxID=2815806 RepID=UPI0039A181D9
MRVTGSYGFGLPYAIGACLANQGRRTILINGDGAFQMNIQELETLVRLQLPVKIFIWNNQGIMQVSVLCRTIISEDSRWQAESPAA